MSRKRDPKTGRFVSNNTKTRSRRNKPADAPKIIRRRIAGRLVNWRAPENWKGA